MVCKVTTFRRRAVDSPRSRRGAAGSDFDAVYLGRLLLATSGLVVNVSAPLLGSMAGRWPVFLIVSAVMAVVLGVSFVVPWQRLPALTTAVFPLLVVLALDVLGVRNPGLLAPLAGLMTLCFAHLGLTHPAWVSRVSVPISAVSFVLLYGSVDGEVVVRVFIACTVWVVLSELLSELQRRHVRMTAALRSAAHMDALTGVPNRRDLELRLPLTQRGDAIVICDLDRFKAVNDTHGHRAGDDVLASFGATLRATLRHDDYFARYGGEEFLIVLPQTSAEQASLLAQRLRAHWHSTLPLTTFSAGIAVRTDEPVVSTVTLADQALYAAKNAGRDRVIVADGQRVHAADRELADSGTAGSVSPAV